MEDPTGWMLLLLGIFAGSISLLSLLGLVYHLWRCFPDERSRFVVGYCGVFFLLGFPGWILVANGLVRLGAPRGVTWTIAIAANVVMQPLLLHMIQGGVRQLVKELVGRSPFYGGKIIPRERYTPAEYGRIYRHCLLRDLVGTLTAAALSLACLSPWL